MRRLALPVLALALAATPALARAEGDDDTGSDIDSVSAPPPAQLLDVRGTLDGITAALVIRYELDLPGPGLSRGELTLDLPDAGIATSAAIRVDGATHVLTLGDTAELLRAIDAVGAAPGGAHRAWAFAILAVENHDQVSLDVAAPHPARVVVILHVTAPTCYFHDARYVGIAPAWVPRLDPGLRTRSFPALEAACGAGGGDELARKLAWIRFPSLDLARQPGGEPRVGIASGRLALPSTDVGHVELDLAGVVGDVPPDLYTAILVDNSRSVSARAQWEQRVLVASYLAKAPAGHVQIIAYDRRPRALLPAWSVAAQVRSGVAARLEALAPANGSNLDLGLAEAARWLGEVHGTRRVIAFTDEALPWRLNAAQLGAALPPATLVHVVAVHGRDAVLARDDTSRLALFAAATEGVGFATESDTSLAGGPVDATVLARPLALEHVQVDAPGWTQLDPGDGTACRDDLDLEQGHGCTWWGTAQMGAGPIRIAGLLWNHAVVRLVTPTPSRDLAIARVLASLGANLDEGLRVEVERAALAVDSVWSLAAIWGGTDGYAGRAALTIGLGSISTCACDDRGIGRFEGESNPTIREDRTLKQQLARELAGCHLAGTHVAVDLELTGDEIVAVQVRAPEAITSCVTEAVWSTPLLLGDRAHRLEHVDF